MSFSGKLLQNIAPGKHSYTHFYTLSVDDYFSRVGRLIFPQVKGVFKKKKLAERGGFEPPYPRRRVNGFRDRRIRPLCHLSLCLQAYATSMTAKGRGHELQAQKWRRVRDLNPGYASRVYTISNRAPSATRTTLRILRAEPCLRASRGRVPLKINAQ